jgi:hypothetical protein
MQISPTNNSNVGLPSVGVAGGTGDKLIFSAGTPSIHPYSLGIDTNTSWYSFSSGVKSEFLHYWNKYIISFFNRFNCK